MTTNRTSVALDVFESITKASNDNPESRGRFLAIVEKYRKMEEALAYIADCDDLDEEGCELWQSIEAKEALEFDPLLH